MTHRLLAFNPWSVKYVLIYGRSSENDTAARKSMYADLQQGDFTLLTFDNLVSAKNNSNPGRRNIVKISNPGPTFSYVYLNDEPQAEFAYLNHGKFAIENDTKQLLVHLGFDLNSWETGKLLSANRGRNLPSIYDDV
jgi:hypothetical protein